MDIVGIPLRVVTVLFYTVVRTYDRFYLSSCNIIRSIIIDDNVNITILIRNEDSVHDQYYYLNIRLLIFCVLTVLYYTISSLYLALGYNVYYCILLYYCILYIVILLLYTAIYYCILYNIPNNYNIVIL